MKIIHKENNKYLVRFDYGEELISELKTFCQKYKIQGGYFTGIGAAQEVILASFDLDRKKYTDELIKNKLEIAGVIGNIAMLKSETIVHVHGTFSDPQQKVFAGHIKKLIVYATCEIVLEVFHKIVKRRFDKNS